VGEVDVVVFDALVGHPERLALLERHVAPVALPGGDASTSAPTPRNPSAGVREEVGAGAPEVGEPPAVAERGFCGSDVCRGSVGGDCGGVCGAGRPRTLAIKSWGGHRPHRD
jgi:hypothetical protein